jgi:hypothetical protein
MTDTRTAWTQVGDHLSALCLKLKLHAEEELSDDDVCEKAGLNRLRAAIDETAEAIGDAYTDEAVREDARRVGESFIAAVDATMKDLRERVSSKG